MGMYKHIHGQRQIRYNAAIFAKYFDDNLANTVPHEVAHYIIDIQNQGFWRSRVRPHGVERETLMKEFGVDASRTASYDMGDKVTRKYTRIAYACTCQQHQLGIRRHNKVVRNTASYYCHRCGDALKPV